MDQAEALEASASVKNTPELSERQRLDMLYVANKRINADALLTPQQIHSLMGIDISHHRDRLKEKILAEMNHEEESSNSSTETVLVLILAIGISLGIGVFSLQIL